MEALCCLPLMVLFIFGLALFFDFVVYVPKNLEVDGSDAASSLPGPGTTAVDLVASDLPVISIDLIPPVEPKAHADTAVRRFVLVIPYPELAEVYAHGDRVKYRRYFEALNAAAIAEDLSIGDGRCPWSWSVMISGSMPVWERSKR